MAKYIKPTLNTKFHIDFAWWQQSTNTLSADLRTHACEQAKEAYEQRDPDQPTTFDWINPDTGEVFTIDILWYYIVNHCADDPDFINDFTPLTTGIFRVFLANNNTPLTPKEIHTLLPKKSADIILRTIGGRRTFKGIRPIV